MNLNPQQLTAAHCAGAIVLVPAAAGSGKTRVLVERIQWLLDQGVSASDICAVTFTSAAAKEIATRVAQTEVRKRIHMTATMSISNYSILEDLKCETHPCRLGHCGTLHALLLKMLRQHADKLGLLNELSVMDEDEADEQLKNIAASFKVKSSLKSLQEAVACVLASGADNDSLSKTGVVAAEFIRQMKQTGEFTYDALLSFGHRLALLHPECFPFKHLLVDEVQDNAVTDWRIYEAMLCETKFYVGDPRQRIFSFRGSSATGFNLLAGRPDTHLRPLTLNFRSSQAVVAAGNRLEGKNLPTEWRPDAPVSVVTLQQFSDAVAEVGFVVSSIACLPPEQTAAVLLRTNKAADLFKVALAHYGFEPRRTEGKSEVELLALAMLRAMVSPHNDRAQLKFVELATDRSTAEALKKYCVETMSSINAVLFHLTDLSRMMLEEPADLDKLVLEYLPRRPDGKTVPITRELMEASQYLQKFATQLPLPCTLTDLLLLAQAREPEAPRGRIHVGTVHSAKGLEWDHVLLPAFEDEAWPGKKIGEEEAEERRLAYVAITRARLTCQMSWCNERPNPFQTWKKETRTPSRFALEAIGGVK